MFHSGKTSRSKVVTFCSGRSCFCWLEAFHSEKTSHWNLSTFRSGNTCCCWLSMFHSGKIFRSNVATICWQLTGCCWLDTFRSEKRTFLYSLTPLRPLSRQPPPPPPPSSPRSITTLRSKRWTTSPAVQTPYPVLTFRFAKSSRPI